MINQPFAVYFATKLELRIWSPLNEQYEANNWQHPDWVNKPESINPKNQPDVTPDNMTANPYRRYCKDHGLQLGTKIKPVSKIKYNSAVLLISAIEPLKHLAGAIESFVRVFLSTGIYILSTAATGLNRICPSKVKVALNFAKENLQSPQANLSSCIKEVVIFALYCSLAPGICYTHWNTYNITGIHTDLSRKVGEMNGTYISLSSIYKEMQET